MSNDIFESGDGERIEEVRTAGRGTGHSTVTESLDAIFELLSDSRRRYVLYHLFAMDGDVAEYETVVTAVCEYETAVTGEIDHSTREDVRVSLHHDHLPRLANAGVLEYDRRHGTIRFAGHPGLGEWIRHTRAEELE